VAERMKTKKLYSFFFLFLFCIAFVSAVPPVQTTVVAPQGLEIEATNFEYLEQNTSHVFRFRVYNATNNVYLNDTHINCSMGIINNEGTYVYQQPVVTATGYKFAVVVDGGNFSEVVVYHQGINCITNDGVTAGGVKTLSFEVTHTGKEPLSGNVLVLFILLFFIIAGIAIYSFMWVLNKFATLDVTLNQIVLSYSSFGIYLMYYYFANYYWANAFIMDLLYSFLWVCGFMNLFIVMVLFVLTLIKQFGEMA